MPTIPPTNGSSNNPNTEAEQHELKHIKVYLTGYGPFRGIAENPSGQIANSLLPETSIYIHPRPHLTLRITIHPHSTPIRVAYADVDRTVSEIYNTASFDYILHVGVGLAGGFELEKIAYGDGYYMGDVDGLVPGGEKAKSDEDLRNEGLLRHWGGDGSTGLKQDVPMGTGLDVDWIVKMKPSNNNKKPSIPKGYKIRSSKDAGGYLCEYIYRKSLEQAISRRKKGGRKPWDWVLFMHVPPVGNMYNIAEDIDCLKQVVVGMVLDGEKLRKP
ncbi:hypothetical protein EV426DRAFT_529487 [Tirmania nivea]|nr:hypothetical protein EV426DRAFT_529487 [Tirmania nivea]